MKIKVRGKFGDYERTFEISCGSGDNKTFKWLGNVITQRFAQCAPNGVLRHRDHFRGTTDEAQHTCSEIRFTDGQMPHPTAIISDFLRDGDEVHAKLVTTLDLERETAHPKISKWANEAFSSGNGPAPREDASAVDMDGEPDSTTLVTIHSKASFMRLVLRSQMVDTAKIESNVSIHFRVVIDSMPRLVPAHRDQFRSIFEAHFLPLQEVFKHFAPDESMTKDNYFQFTEDCGLFSRDIVPLSTRIHLRTCQALAAHPTYASTTSNTTFGLGGFMVSLILAAQLRHNDTFESESSASSSPAAALQEIMDRNIVEFAERNFFPSVSRLVFCSDETLYGVRVHHHELFTVFEKYAQKSNILPTSLKIDHLVECFQAAGLADIKKDKALQLFNQTRESCVYGRNSNPNPNLDAPKFTDEPPPDNELIYSEFVECCARAGAARFFNNPTIGMRETGEMMSLSECMLKGIKAVVSVLNPPAPVTTNPGRK